MLKKILLSVALAFPMLLSAQTLKIAVVDINALIAEMPETKDAQTQIQERSQRYEDEYKKLGEEMNRKLEEYQNMSENELPAIRERKTRELQDYQLKIQQFEEQAQRDLTNLQQSLMAPIINKVRGAVESVGKEGGFSLVQNYEPSMIFYFADPVVDITSLVKAKL